MDFMLKEREAGRIRHLGFSFHGKQDAFDHFLSLHDKYHWDFVQIEMNYLDWEHAKVPRNVNADYLYEELDKRELPIVVMEPLLGGRLASVPERLAEMMKEREPEKSIASWAFRFCGSYPRILTVLSGMASMDPLIENVETYSHFQPIDGKGPIETDKFRRIERVASGVISRKSVDTPLQTGIKAILLRPVTMTRTTMRSPSIPVRPT